MLYKIRYYLYLKKKAFREWVQSLHRARLFLNRAQGSGKKLLIVKLDSIGDYLLFRNYLRSIKESKEYGDHEITVCGNQWWKEIAEKHDHAWVKNFIWVDYGRLSDYEYNMGVSRRLFAEAFNVAITPTYSRCRFTDELMLQSGAKEKIAHMGDSVNIDPAQKVRNDKRYDRLIKIKGNLDFEFERNRQFFGELVTGARFPEVPFFVADPEKSFDVVIAPGAKAAFRQWSPSNYYALALYLFKISPGLRFCICGSVADKPIAEKIMRSGEEIVFTDLTGNTGLEKLAHIIAGSRLVLCNDSGPYHLAAALGIPLICISNANHFGRFCPYPSKYGKRNLEIFPPSFHNMQMDEKTMLTLQSEGSTLDINEISIEQVVSAITKKNFLNAAGLSHHS